MNVIDEVRGFLGSNLRIADADTIAPETPLLQQGVIDSIELLQLVMFLEQRFAIAIDETEVLPCNFRTLTAMAGFVAAKQETASRAPG